MGSLTDNVDTETDLSVSFFLSSTSPERLLVTERPSTKAKISSTIK